jgi:hypothetical protein
MSNRIDLYQSANTDLSIPTATVTVFLEGNICPFLEVLDITKEGWPEFNRAKLRFNSTKAPEGLFSEESFSAEQFLGKSISIQQVYNNTPPDISIASLPIFVGRIESTEKYLSASGQNIEFFANDFSAQCQQIKVYGQRVYNYDGHVLFLPGADTVFNDNGKANASEKLIESNGSSYTAFCQTPSLAKKWSYAEAIDYLLCEYLPPGHIRKPTLEQLRVLTDNQLVGEFDVTGLNLLEVIHQCCIKIGLEFKFIPSLNAQQPIEFIDFYKIGRGRTIELNSQPKGESLCISKINIASLKSNLLSPTTNKYIGLGDFKVYEATFDLVQAWDPAEEFLDFPRYSPSTNPEFHKLKNVFRKWCLNEAGDYSPPPYNRGNPFDFSNIFNSNNFTQRRRRFYPCLSTDKGQTSIGYFVQASYDNGVTWRQYLYAFNNLLYECGIWLSSNQLDDDIWVGLVKGKLRFRITASIISDERLNCSITDGPLNSSIPVAEKPISLSRQFKYRKVSSQSIFHNSKDPSVGIPDQVDDSTQLYEFVRKKALSASVAYSISNVKTPYLATYYQVGDMIKCKPQGRDLLNLRNCHCFSWIKHIRMDFKNQYTNLKIVKQKKVLL